VKTGEFPQNSENVETTRDVEAMLALDLNKESERNTALSLSFFELDSLLRITAPVQQW
jgi:hypothetical protein